MSNDKNPGIALFTNFTNTPKIKKNSRSYILQLFFLMQVI